MLGIALPEQDVETDFLVDEDNWQTVMLFCQCATQWRYGAFGGVIGMDYAGVNAVLDLTVKRRDRADVFEGLQVMERAALAVMNEKTK